VRPVLRKITAFCSVLQKEYHYVAKRVCFVAEKSFSHGICTEIYGQFAYGRFFINLAIFAVILQLVGMPFLQDSRFPMSIWLSLGRL
jgi:hypothetical protein